MTGDEAMVTIVLPSGVRHFLFVKPRSKIEIRVLDGVNVAVRAEGEGELPRVCVEWEEE